MAMRSELKVFQIFKAGTHITMKGVTFEFTPQDLQAMADVYQPSLKKAALCLGHPADNLPSYGEVAGLFVKGDRLYAQAHPNADLVSLVRKGSYGPVSASFHHPTSPENPRPGAYYLRHVGFLGAMPPAVKGLVRPEFTEPAGAICFAEGYRQQDGLSETLTVLRSGKGLENDREEWHRLTLKHQDSNPDLSYSEALEQVRGIATTFRPGVALDPHRLAIHNAALNHQAACPDMSYAEAAQQASRILTF
ncbi:hypothetical protein [Pseudomonas putida]|uniref:hypothetical protein n=1 Tax=Pseudomonas putida TaxID=303 RepID=UPI000CD44B4B|nr:hypothetical protein [Pseudomonas putida]POF97677.1 hypothetical protein BGP81_13510 [Pseudomonas putida]